MIKENVGNVLGFQIKEDLGNYLGMPLFHTRTTKCTFQFLVYIIHNKLNGYDAKLLTLGGRVTLAKFVLLRILGYFMQSTMISISVCEQIEKIVRHFVSGSTTSGLVNWDACCKP